MLSGTINNGIVMYCLWGFWESGLKALNFTA